MPVLTSSTWQSKSNLANTCEEHPEEACKTEGLGKVETRGTVTGARLGFGLGNRTMWERCGSTIAKLVKLQTRRTE